MAPTQSFGGASRLSDYSGSDTSPQNPPSGNFGPPIHSLSLGEGSDGSFPSLFPSAIPLTSVSSSTGTSTLDGALPQSSFTPKQQQNSSKFSSQPQQQKQSHDLQQQQLNERARQQIRAELMGVDSRALKGPLRDIQQGMGQDDNQQAILSNFTFNAYQPNTFFPEYPSSSSSGRPGGLIRQRSGSLDESFLTSNLNVSSAGLGWSGLPTNDFNAFDLQGLDGYRSQIPYNQQTPQLDQQQDMYNTPSSSQTSLTSTSNNYNRPGLPGPQFSARTQQAVDRARAQKPTRKRMTRDGSGLTVSPQDAFLDYNNIDNLLQQSSQAPIMPISDRAFIGAPSAGLQSMISSDSSILTPKATSSFDDISSGPAPFGPSSVVSTNTHEGTPSLVDASSSSSNGSRATSMVSSPLQRLPLNREDTVRPPKKKMTDSASQQSILSNDLFSPAYSTSSSTDDEDEKPYKSNSQGAAPIQSVQQGPAQQQGKWQFPFPSQASKDQMASLTHQPHSGPRFSVVSSSSSESEDDDQRGRQKNNAPYNTQGRRSMGGYGYMGSSQESGMSVSTPYFSSTQSGNTSMQVPPVSSSQDSSPFYPSSNSQHATAVRARQSDNTTPQSAGGQSDSQSQDEGPKLSPSIRTSAQAINPPIDSRNAPSNSHYYQNSNSASTGQRNQSRNRAQAQQAALSAASTAAANANRAVSEAGHSSMESNSEWETGEDSEADGSDYGDVRKSGATTTRKAPGTRKRRRDGTAGGGRSGGGGGRSGGTGHTSSTASHLTVCDYVSPLSGEACRTEFHRPYDLARHRETIHAREEALLVKQGRLKKEQCIVLYREVDPAKSLATVEWKCEGKNGCGSLFSRKDALLRHKRIRGH